MALSMRSSTPSGSQVADLCGSIDPVEVVMAAVLAMKAGRAEVSPEAAIAGQPRMTRPHAG